MDTALYNFFRCHFISLTQDLIKAANCFASFASFLLGVLGAWNILFHSAYLLGSKFHCIWSNSSCRSRFPLPILGLVWLFLNPPEGDWDKIILSQACGGINPPQSSLFLLISGTTEHSLSQNQDTNYENEETMIHYQGFSLRACLFPLNWVEINWIMDLNLFGPWRNSNLEFHPIPCGSNLWPGKILSKSLRKSGNRGSLSHPWLHSHPWPDRLVPWKPLSLSSSIRVAVHDPRRGSLAPSSPTPQRRHRKSKSPSPRELGTTIP
jgi:hypothetical protein